MPACYAGARRGGAPITSALRDEEQKKTQLRFLSCAGERTGARGNRSRRLHVRHAHRGQRRDALRRFGQLKQPGWQDRTARKAADVAIVVMPPARACPTSRDMHLRRSCLRLAGRLHADSAARTVAIARVLAMHRDRIAVDRRMQVDVRQIADRRRKQIRQGGQQANRSFPLTTNHTTTLANCTPAESTLPQSPGSVR